MDRSGLAAPLSAGERATAQPSLFTGAISCAATACHNANGPPGSKGSEYSTWSALDKHARAYEVLFSPDSERIIRHLHGANARPASETTLCLKCHVHCDATALLVRKEEPSAGRMRLQLSDGVGCESCHGPAQEWRSTHYLPSQRGKRDGNKGIAAPRDTRNLQVRAETCVGCHVGNADADVNHDLIAAGHPRLRFEFGAYHANMPKHWQEQGENASADFQARAWLTGQVVSAKAAVELLRERACSGKSWPEFAEYNCVACHKDLTLDGPKQRFAYFKSRHPGSFSYGTWYLAMVPLLEWPVRQSNSDLQKKLKQLREIMERPAPAASIVADESKGLADLMDGLLKDVRKMKALDQITLHGHLNTLLNEGERRAHTMVWEEAAQFYLTIAALHHALSDMNSPAIRSSKPRQAAMEIRFRLDKAFPTGSNSPQLFNPSATPPMPSLADQFRALRDSLTN